MPQYTVQDTTTGKQVTFDWNDKVAPTDADIEEVFAAARTQVPKASSGPEFNPDMYPSDKPPAEQVVRPIMEAGGLLGGGAIGAASPVPGGSVIGAGLGYGMGKGAADWLYGTNKDQSVGGSLLSAAKDVGTGAMMEMGGQVAGKALGGGVDVAGKLGKQLVGKMTGAGPGATTEAAKGGQAFTDAMRGKISGEEIVNNAKDALQVIKDNRAAAYQDKLGRLQATSSDGFMGTKQIDITPIQIKLADLMKRFGVRVEADTSLNLTRTALGRSGNKDVEEIVQKIRGWGQQPGDKTAVGLDTLKRQLDDFYSESSNARAFVASLRNEVKSTIVKSVPEYATMTKDYAEATNLIKDMEAGLSLKKQGMSGRVVADQTLRRLMSSMRDNFQLRKELLDVLGNQSGQDLSGQVAGYTMSSYLPLGLAGVAPSMAGTAAMLKYINPKFVPLLAASSPRLMGEFLRFMGKVPTEGGSMAAGKAAAYLTVPPAENLLTTLR